MTQLPAEVVTQGLDTGPLFLLAGIWSVVGIAFYVWYLWSLSRLFPHLGIRSAWGWIPVWNQWQLIQRGGFPGALVILAFVPVLNIVAFVITIMAIHRLNTEFGRGAGMTVLGALLAPLWAMLLTSHIADGRYGAAAQWAPARSTAPSSANGAAQGLPPVPQQHTPVQPWQAPGQPHPAAAPPAGAPNAAVPHAAAPPAQAPAQSQAPAQAPAQQNPAFPAPHQSQQQPQQPQPQQRSIFAPPAGAQEPRRDAWGFSSATEGKYERLAAEDAPLRAAAPLGSQRVDPPFSWPANQTDEEAGSELNKSVDPANPDSGTTSRVVKNDAADTSADAPVDPAAPAGTATPVGTEPPINTEPPVAPASPATPVAAAASAAPAASPDRESPTGTRTGTSTSTSTSTSTDEDRTVVVPRGPAWGLELPDGDVLELPSDDVVVGRKPKPIEESDVLQIADPTRTLSKSHVRLRRNGNSWTIEDLESTNGVSLIADDGKKIELDSGETAVATRQLLIGTLEVTLLRVR